MPAGTTIAVYTAGGQEIYTVTVGTNTSYAGSDPYFGPAYPAANFNTGLFPFNDYPVYLSYSPSGVGAIYLDA